MLNSRHVAVGVGVFALTLITLQYIYGSYGNALHPIRISPHWWLFAVVAGVTAWIWSQIHMTRDGRLTAVAIVMVAELLTNGTFVGALAHMLVDVFMVVAIVDMIVERRSINRPTVENASSRLA